MLQPILANSEPIAFITIHMPTEREHSKHNPKPWEGQHNPEIKYDTSTFRLPWLMAIRHNAITAWLSPGTCPVCFSIRLVISLLALYGVYSLFF